MSLKDLEYLKKIKDINLVETSVKRGFEDMWLYNQEIEFKNQNIEIINFSLKEAKSIIYNEISDYLYKLSKKNYYFKNFDLIIAAIKQEYKGLKRLIKGKYTDLNTVSYYLTFLLSLIKSIDKKIER